MNKHLLLLLSFALIPATILAGEPQVEEEIAQQYDATGIDVLADKPKDTAAKPKNEAPKKNEKKTDSEVKEPAKKMPMYFKSGDSEFRISTRFRPEMFYGKNLRFLNDLNPTDRVFYFRHVLDFVTEYNYGRESTGHSMAMVKMNIRNRGVWGDPESIASTTESDFKRLDITQGLHRHGLPVHILWVRELWLQMSLNDIFGIKCANTYSFALGLFPFELGRGIALGSAYGVGPDLLGYYAESAIDQYAPGFLLSGDIFKDRLTFDLYTEIVSNKANSFDRVNAKVLGQIYGHRYNPARGFLVANYIMAGRLKWTPYTQERTKVSFEPYVVYNDEREQKLEVLADASAKLITPGISGEFTFGDLDFGFDTAFNLGHQKVKGLDRNVISEENRDGFQVVTNSHVKQIDPVTKRSRPALKIDENQEIINESLQCEQENSQVIGSNQYGVLVNDRNRFRDPYRVKFGGSMFVFDIGYYICNPEFKINGMVGFASGDENPHRSLHHHENDNHIEEFEYDGFISIQEVYSGTRVKSAFLLSGVGKVPRALSFPSEEIVNGEPYPSIVSKLNNIIFTGFGFQAKQTRHNHKWNFNPNVIAYWQDVPTRRFDLKNRRMSTNEFVHNFLGTELNLFAEAEIFPDLRFFTVAALFFPGQHFKELAGHPLNKQQKAFIEALKTGKRVEKQPILGQNSAWFLNAGFEYKY